MGNNSSNHTVSQLLNEGKKYLLLQLEYIKLTVTEKISIILGMSVLFLVVLVLSVGGGIYLSFALVYLLEPLVGIVGSFAIVGGLFLLIAGIVFIFRKAIILNIISRFVSRVLLNDKDPEIK